MSSKHINARQGMDQLTLMDQVNDEALAAIYDEHEALLQAKLGPEGYMAYVAITQERDAALQEQQEAHSQKRDELVDQIKAAVIHYRGSMRGGLYRCDYVEPSPKWDGKLLDGYALAHPEVLACKKPAGPPYARLVKIKK